MAVRPTPPRDPAASEAGMIRSIGEKMQMQAAALMGGIKPRWSRALANIGQVVLKVPKNMAADEYNVVLGIPRTAHAAGASPLMTCGPLGRDVILREMIVAEVSLAAGAVGTRDYTLLQLQSETQNLEPFGNANIMVFDPFNLSRPQFDLPVGQGSNATVQFQNNSMVAGVLSGGFIID